MMIYSGTTTDRSGKRTAYYSDVLDCLPPDIRGFCIRYVPPLDEAQIRAAIVKSEAAGWRVNWQVGTFVYESPE